MVRKTIIAIAGVLVLVAAPASAHVVTMTAALDAAEEVPEPGPPGATGNAEVSINDEARELCYTLTYQGIGKPTAAHVHQGAAGTAGPVVIDLGIADHGDQACITADQTALEEVLADPEGHYVNIHTSEHPKGALRGQLRETSRTPA